jgi:CubicO group peptidase (beta-lactamase class C family)
MWGTARFVAVAALVLAACSSGTDSAASAPAVTPAVTSTETLAVATPTIRPANTEPPPEQATTTMPATTQPPVTQAPATTSAPATAPERDFSAIDPIVQDFIDANGLNGAGLVIVDREDGVVHEQYWGEFDADRVSFIASSSKMLTAGVLVRLADQGLIDLDAPVADAVDWGAGNPEITPAQLMSNSSGLVGLFPDPAYRPYLCQFLPNGDIEDCGEVIFETPDDDADLAAPDTEFRYGGAQWQVAGALAEAVSGSTWAELIDETYVRPCGVDSLGYNNHFSRSAGFDYPALDPASLPPTENPNMEGGAFIDPPDYGRLLLMHLRGGECDGGRVLDAASVDLMHADRTLSAYGAGAPGYGMGWWVDRATGRIRDPGAYGAVPWLDLDRGYGAYLVVEATSDLGGRLSALVEPEIDAAMANG